MSDVLREGRGDAGSARQRWNVEHARDDRPELVGGRVVRSQQLLDRRADGRSERTLGERHLNESDQGFGDLVAARGIGRPGDGPEGASDIVDERGR